MSNSQAIFVTGTNTGVGKTMLSAYLARVFSEAGWPVSYHKPIETGWTAHANDPLTVLAYAPATVIISGQRLKLPAAPAQAALSEGIELDFEDLLSKAKAASLSESLNIIEGAGGLLVPLTKSYCLIDLIEALNIPTVLVSSNELGCINHTALSLLALKARQVPVLGFLFSAKSNSAESAVLETNAGWIERLTGSIYLGELGDLSKKDAPETTIEPLTWFKEKI